MSQAKLLDASSGILSFGAACAAAEVAQEATLRQMATESEPCHAFRHAWRGASDDNVDIKVSPLAARFSTARPLRTPHARHRGNVAMRLATNIVLDSQVVAQIERKARLP